MNPRQFFIDNDVEKDTLLNNISVRDESMKQHRNF